VEFTAPRSNGYQSRQVVAGSSRGPSPPQSPTSIAARELNFTRAKASGHNGERSGDDRLQLTSESRTPEDNWACGTVSR
jgi:hypothetical protein